MVLAEMAALLGQVEAGACNRRNHVNTGGGGGGGGNNFGSIKAQRKMVVAVLLSFAR